MVQTWYSFYLKDSAALWLSSPDTAHEQLSVLSAVSRWGLQTYQSGQQHQSSVLPSLVVFSLNGWFVSGVSSAARQRCHLLRVPAGVVSEDNVTLPALSQPLLGSLWSEGGQLNFFSVIHFQFRLPWGQVSLKGNPFFLSYVVANGSTPQCSPVLK